MFEKVVNCVSLTKELIIPGLLPTYAAVQRSLTAFQPI